MINGFVRGQSLTVPHVEVVANSNNYLEVQFIFQTADWKFLNKTAYFEQGAMPYAIHLKNDRISRDDKLNLAEGVWNVYLKGTSAEGDLRITTNVATLKVKPTGHMCIDPPEIPLTQAEDFDNRISALEAGGGGGEGTADHTKLFNREKANQHPISAITGLDEALEGKQPKGDYVTVEELANAKEWQTAEITMTSETEGTSSLSSQEIYEAYLKGVYTMLKDKTSDVTLPVVLVSSSNSCIASTLAGNFIGTYEIAGNKVNFGGTTLATKTDISNASTLVVTITANPFDRQSYVADVGAREIYNAAGQGRTVEAHFEDTVEGSGDQIYEYLKFKDNSAYFRRFYLMPDKVTVRQIDIEIKLNKEVVFTDTKAEFATADDVQNLRIDKLDVKYEPIQGKEVSQLEARAILENATEYEDKFIIFMANSGSPTKAVATGFISNDGEGNTYLAVTDNEGHYKRFNKDNFETFEIIAKDRTKETLSLDDLTIDVQGQAGFINSVHNAFNRPENTSADGIIKVVAYNIENQLQEYTDVKSGFKYIRLVAGTANQHSFGMWQRADIVVANAKVNDFVCVASVDSNNFATGYKAVTIPTAEGAKF